MTIILKIKKRAFIIAILILLLSIFILINLILFTVKNKNVVIRKDFHTISFVKNAILSLSNETTITHFLTNNDAFIVKAQHVVSKENNKNILTDNNINTAKIRNKIYTGYTKTIITDKQQNTFNIPEKMYLKNGENNYIHTKELHGSLDGIIISEFPVAVNDDDIFISGNNILIKTNEDYFLITQKAHVINTKIEQNDTKTYDVKSDKMEFFGKKHVAELKKNVIFQTLNDTIKSQYGKIFLTEDNKIKDIFLRQNVKIIQKDKIITSDFAFFDSIFNLVVLYKNISMNMDKAKSVANFYIYNTETKIGMSFNEQTILKQKEKQHIYEVFNKLSMELNGKEKQHVLNTIKLHQKNTKNKQSIFDNQTVIKRDGRVKIKISNS